jgi:hypothetical protein
VASKTAFLKAGYQEVVTYADPHRSRDTTVLKFSSAAAAAAANPMGNSQRMRVIGLQSGNAVDGINVGIFEFDPVNRSKEVSTDFCGGGVS